MNTRKAFEKLISERAIWHKLGITGGALRKYRNQIKNDDWPSTEIMDELLMKAGYKVVQEKQWAVK